MNPEKRKNVSKNPFLVSKRYLMKKILYFFSLSTKQTIFYYFYGWKTSYYACIFFVLFFLFYLFPFFVNHCFTYFRIKTLHLQIFYVCDDGTYASPDEIIYVTIRGKILYLKHFWSVRVCTIFHTLVTILVHFNSAHDFYL